MDVKISYKNGDVDRIDSVTCIEDCRMGYDPIIKFIDYDSLHGTLKEVKYLLDSSKINDIIISF